jgi:hypothetical protein
MSETPTEPTEPTETEPVLAAGFPPGTGATGSDTAETPAPTPDETETPAESAPDEAPAAPEPEAETAAPAPAPGADTEAVHAELVSAARALVEAIEGIYEDSGLRGEVVAAKGRVRDLLKRLEGTPEPEPTPTPEAAAAA